MHILDWLVIFGYFAILFGVAWYAIRKNRNTTDDYFLAGRNLGWFVIGASIFASNIGSEHLVGLAGTGATDGVAMAHFELHAWCLLVLGWVFVPFYMRSRVFTMPEFLEKRFNSTSRWVLSLISLVAYVLTKIAVGIFAGGIVFSVLLPEIQWHIGVVTVDSFWIGSVLVMLLTGLYTVLGGLRAVAYTEALQTFVLIAGSVMVTVFGLYHLGGWSELRAICGSEMFNLWKPIVPDGVEGTWSPVIERNDAGDITRQAWYFNGNYPWLGMLFAAPIIGLWYWCTDQYIVQRALGAPNEQQARRGSIWAGLLKLLPVFIFIIPGMIAFALFQSNQLPSLALTPYTDDAPIYVQRMPSQDGTPQPTLYTPQQLDQAGLPEVARTSMTRPHPNTGEPVTVYASPAVLKHWIDNDASALDTVERQNNAAFPLLVKEILPVGVRGLVVAGLLAALMSSLAGVFNASATLFTIDFYSKLHPNVSQRHLVWIGRVATACLIVIGLLWIPVIRQGKNLYDYLQSVQAYLAPPIFAVFLLGVFSKRLNGKGALAALLVGFLMGLVRLGIDTPAQLMGTKYASGTFFWFMNNLYFQYYSLVIFIVCVVTMIGVSVMTSAPVADKVRGLTYQSLSDEDRAESRASWSWRDVLASAALLLAILAAYLYFNG